MARDTQFISVKEAANLINDGDIVASGGFIGTGVAEEIHAAVEARYIETGAPRDLTLIYAAGQGDGKTKGANHYAHEGLLKRVIGGHWGLAPKLAPLVNENKVAGYNIPQGVVSHMFRDAAAGKPRTITHVGLGTFADPEVNGCKLNELANEYDIVERVYFDDKPYLAYKAHRPNICFLKGTVSDKNGNISMSEEPLTLEGLAIAMATKNNGGKVVIQVKDIVENATINPHLVKIPGALVDYVVKVDNLANHMQTFGTEFNPDFVNAGILAKGIVTPYPNNERKVMARRAAMLLNKSKYILNYGIGVPEVIADVLVEEGQDSYFSPTVEPGIYGGTPQGGLNFGASVFPEAIIDQCSQFDFYDGGGIDHAFLGMAELDKHGNVNVSKFGPKIAGAGGFINITQNAKEVTFLGSFTAGGFKATIENNELKILNEGKAQKLVDKVGHITFSGEIARQNGKKVTYITERCIFEMKPEGLTLTEIAPGIDLQNDIIARMAFTPRVAEDLKVMDSRIFNDGKMGLVL